MSEIGSAIFRKTLTSCLFRVQHHRERIGITKHRKVVAVIIPVVDAKKLAHEASDRASIARWLRSIGDDGLACLVEEEYDRKEEL